MGSIDDIAKPGSNTKKCSEIDPITKYIFIGVIAVSVLADAALLGGAGFTSWDIHKKEKTAGKESAYNLAKEYAEKYKKSIVFCGSRVVAKDYINAYESSKGKK